MLLLGLAMMHQAHGLNQQSLLQQQKLPCSINWSKPGLGPVFGVWFLEGHCRCNARYCLWWLFYRDTAELLLGVLMLHQAHSIPKLQ